MIPNFHAYVDELFHDWNYGHPKILYGFIRAMKPQVVVEVGTYRGYAACWMARALQENGSGRLYCIDNFQLTEHVHKYGDPRKHCEDNFAKCGVSDVITILEGRSDEVEWPEKVDMAYIDGWHSHKQASADFIKAAAQGAKLIALDDTDVCFGPRYFADNWIDEDWDSILISSDNGMGIFKRKEDRRLITFSQEMPHPNPGVDIRGLTKDQQIAHLEASGSKQLSHYVRFGLTEHI